MFKLGRGDTRRDHKEGLQCCPFGCPDHIVEPCKACDIAQFMWVCHDGSGTTGNNQVGKFFRGAVGGLYMDMGVDKAWQEILALGVNNVLATAFSTFGISTNYPFGYEQVRCEPFLIIYIKYVRASYTKVCLLATGCHFNDMLHTLLLTLFQFWHVQLLLVKLHVFLLSSVSSWDDCSRGIDNRISSIYINIPYNTIPVDILSAYCSFFFSFICINHFSIVKK
jgi:hypothetical protein